MGEYEEYYYSCDPEPARRARRWTFSVAALVRATTLVALTLGWFILVANVPSPLTQFIVLLVAAIFAAIVGYRRFGRLSARCRAAFLFFGGGIIIALYSGYVAHAIQNPIKDDHHWAALDQAFSILPIIAAFPIAIVVIVFMLRSWIWSAHDQTIHRQ